MRNKILKEIKNRPLVYFCLAAVLLGAVFVRIYKVGEILGFYYDQGRDALVIWDLWYKGKFFLIGPTTGIEGVFRGPWYYWLIAPFYLIGKGNPVWPAVFLSLTTVSAIAILFHLGTKIANRTTGLLAAMIAAFSCYLVLASRWLSNPTPMLLISVLLVWMMILVTEGKKKAWLAIAFLLGMAMQFGSAAEIFYFPAVVIFAIWQKKNLPNKKILFLSFFLLLTAFLPQIVFNTRHDGVLFSAIKRFLVEGKSFKLSFWEVLRIRLPFYWDTFAHNIWPKDNFYLALFSFAALGSLIINFKKLWRNDGFKIILLFLITPLIGMLFFQGNNETVYGYYFTGYYLIYVLLFSILLGSLFNVSKGCWVLALFVIAFLSFNLPLLRSHFKSELAPFTFADQKKALDWIYQDANGKDFNVDVYVPPVIPHAYDYLFLWYGQKMGGYLPAEEGLNLLYTLYEIDLPHPERLEAWLERQEGIGKIEKEMHFAGITVQRRGRK